MLLFTKYKCAWLTAINMSLSHCITYQDVCVQPGPPREILPGGTKTDIEPPYFLGPSSELV